MYSLLGVHVNTAQGNLLPALKGWKPPLVVCLDHSDTWREVKEASPDTVFVGRIAMNSEPDLAAPDTDPLLSARAHCEKVLPWAERMGETYDFWQGLNEPILETPEAMKRYADFDAERARIMSAQGFQVVVGSFSVGHPTKLALWEGYLPALEAALQYEGALALHEYAWPTLTRQWPWYLLRHRKVYEGEPRHDWGGLPDHLQNLPLIITECGLDGGIVQSAKPRGWQILYGDDPAQYLKQLNWYDTELQKDPYVVGAALFCSCRQDDPQWGSFNVWPTIVQAITQQSAPVYRLEQLRAKALPVEEETVIEMIMERLDRIIAVLQQPG